MRWFAINLFWSSWECAHPMYVGQTMPLPFLFFFLFFVNFKILFQQKKKTSLHRKWKEQPPNYHHIAISNSKIKKIKIKNQKLRALSSLASTWTTSFAPRMIWIKIQLHCEEIYHCHATSPRVVSMKDEHQLYVHLPTISIILFYHSSHWWVHKIIQSYKEKHP